MVAAGVLVAVLWYGLRGLSRWSARATRVVGWLSPYTRALHRWVLSAPATFAYVGVFTASTIIQRSAPPQLIDLITTYQSTNLVRLSDDPFRVLVTSGLWVDGRGVGLEGYVLVFATAVAWAERRYGTPRLIVIGVSAHVLGSLLVVPIERWALDTHRAPAMLASTSDVGVSYVMVGCCAAAVILLTGRVRVLVAAVLLVATEIPSLWHHSLWDIGHTVAALVGALTAALLLLLRPARRVPLSARRARVPAAATPGTTLPVPAPSASPTGSSVAAPPRPRS